MWLEHKGSLFFEIFCLMNKKNIYRPETLTADPQAQLCWVSVPYVFRETVF